MGRSIAGTPFTLSTAAIDRIEAAAGAEEPTSPQEAFVFRIGESVEGAFTTEGKVEGILHTIKDAAQRFLFKR